MIVRESTTGFPELTLLEESLHAAMTNRKFTAEELLQKAPDNWLLGQQIGMRRDDLWLADFGMCRDGIVENGGYSLPSNGWFVGFGKAKRKSCSYPVNLWNHERDDDLVVVESKEEIVDVTMCLTVDGDIVISRTYPGNVEEMTSILKNK